MSNPKPGGWVKLWRSFGKSPVFLNAELCQLAIYLLLEAARDEDERRVRVGRGMAAVQVQAGQVIVGRHALAKATGQSKGSVHRRLERLAELGFCRIEPTKHYSRVTIVNWSRYQETALESTASEQPKQPRNEPLASNPSGYSEQHTEQPSEQPGEQPSEQPNQPQNDPGASTQPSSIPSTQPSSIPSTSREEEEEKNYLSLLSREEADWEDGSPALKPLTMGWFPEAFRREEVLESLNLWREYKWRKFRWNISNIELRMIFGEWKARGWERLVAGIQFSIANGFKKICENDGQDWRGGAAGSRELSPTQRFKPVPQPGEYDNIGGTM